MTTDTTLGIAIPVPDPLGALLTQWREKVGDPLAHVIPPHVTLLPPTDVAGFQLDDIHQHLAAVARAHAPFQLHLAGTGSFRPVSQVVFVTVAEGISSCELLARDIRSGLLHRQLEFPYHPHVTIAHDLAGERLDEAFEELARYDAEFDVTSCSLYRHDADGVWRPVCAYPLQAVRERLAARQDVRP